MQSLACYDVPHCSLASKHLFGQDRRDAILHILLTCYACVLPVIARLKGFYGKKDKDDEPAP